MEITKAAVGAFALVCVAAGAGGGYLATMTREPAATVAPQPSGPSVSPDPAGPVVDQSEALVAAATPAPVAVPVETPGGPAVRPVRPAPRANDQRPAARPAPRPAWNDAPAPAPEPRPVVAAPIEPPRVVTPEIDRVEPAGPVYQELVIASDSVIGLQVESSVTSETARVEDEIVARVTRDVKVGDRVAIPAGSKAHGEVTLVERGGRLRDRARLGVRFTSVVLADGTRVPLSTETIYREGDGPGQESAAKIGGGAIGGAILGGILGGAKGAAIGGSIGGGAGTAAVLAGGRNAATLTSGSPVTVRLAEPATVTVEK